MNYLKSYENEATYLADATEARMKSGDFLLPNVSFIQDTKVVHYNRYREFPPEVGDIYINDATTNTNRFVSSTEYFNNLVSDSNITPIGIVVIPSSFTDDNKTRVMGLFKASTNIDPTAFGSKDLYWGYKDTVQTKYDYVRDINKATSYFGYFPNTEGTYENTPNLPSPYTSDGDKNPAYFYRALSDMDGEGNTDNIISRVTVADWQTKKYISNAQTEGCYPAAMVCRRYITVGTNRGDWYLPSVGELGFCLVKLDAINNILTNFINNNVEADTIDLYGSAYSSVITSTESKDRVWYAGDGQGRKITLQLKNLAQCAVRPFLKV